MENVVIGIIGTVIGTILGWLLNMLSNSIGRVDVSCVECNCRFFRNNINGEEVGFWQDPDSAELNLIRLNITNFKERTIGLNRCEFKIQYGNNEDTFNNCIQGFINDVQEKKDNFDELLNIPSHFTKEIYYKHGILLSKIDPDKVKNGYRIIFVYHINGKKKEYRKIVHNEKPLSKKELEIYQENFDENETNI